MAPVYDNTKGGYLRPVNSMFIFLWDNIHFALGRKEHMNSRVDLYNWTYMYKPFINYIKAAIVIPQSYWSTENEIIYKNKTMLLRQFNKEGMPVLILPPQAGHHSNICDYAPEQSLVRVLMSRGFNVFVTEWLSASLQYRNLGIEDYIKLTDEAVDKIHEITGFEKIHLIGQCQGGWQAAIYTALNPDKITSLIVAASPIDIDAEHCMLLDYARIPGLCEYWVDLFGGLMPGWIVLQGFKSLDPIEHYWNKYLKLFKNVIKDDKKAIGRYRRFENWYECTQNLPGRFYLEAVNWIFRNNDLVKPGKIKIDEKPVDFRNIKCPLVLLAGKKDDISPPAQTFAMDKYVNSKDIIKILSEGGHIGTLMGNKSLKENWTKIADWVANN